MITKETNEYVDDFFWTPKPNEVPRTIMANGDTPIEAADSPNFHIGYQRQRNERAKAIRCRLCGSNKFYVGTGDYFTAIKCTGCEWEYAVHTG